MTALQPIRALRARISRDAAIEALAGGVAGGVRRLALGPLRSIADVYVPFALFQVIVQRVLSARDEGHARAGTIFAGFL